MTHYARATWSGISGEKHYKFSGPDFSLVSNDWIDEHVQHGHGPLGELYPDIAYIMEGDTPSFLFLIPNGLNAPEHPEWGGWGGRYEKQGGFYTDTADTVRRGRRQDLHDGPGDDLAVAGGVPARLRRPDGLVRQAL